MHIIIPDNTQQQPPQTDEKTAGELLQTLADMDAFSDITDPVAWQREQRRGLYCPIVMTMLIDSNIIIYAAQLQYGDLRMNPV